MGSAGKIQACATVKWGSLLKIEKQWTEEKTVAKHGLDDKDGKEHNGEIRVAGNVHMQLPKEITWTQDSAIEKGPVEKEDLQPQIHTVMANPINNNITIYSLLLLILYTHSIIFKHIQNNIFNMT